MLASTHQNEEEIFIPILKKLLLKINNLKIIIAPRHPERSKSILLNYQKAGISVNIMSKKINSDVLIVNSFGKLDSYFVISDIVFLGGSFVNKGGHNPIEPAINNCVIISGPEIFNWQNIYDNMLEKKACFVFKNILDLENNVINIFENENILSALKDRSKKFTEKRFFDSKKLIYSINNILDTPIC